MPALAKPKLLLPALVIAALLALPAGAGATLSYVKNPFNATVFVASDDGSGARKVETGHNPHVAPNGLSDTRRAATSSASRFRSRAWSTCGRRNRCG